MSIGIGGFASVKISCPMEIIICWYCDHALVIFTMYYGLIEACMLQPAGNGAVWQFWQDTHIHSMQEHLNKCAGHLPRADALERAGSSIHCIAQRHALSSLSGAQHAVQGHTPAPSRPGNSEQP